MRGDEGFDINIESLGFAFLRARALNGSSIYVSGKYINLGAIQCE
jgi:hypothetical protein